MIGYECLIDPLIEKGNVQPLSHYSSSRLDSTQSSQTEEDKEKNVASGRGIMNDVWHHSPFLPFS